MTKYFTVTVRLLSCWISLLLQAHGASNARAANCRKGLFGTECEFQCHCEGDNCNSDGSCVGTSRCETDWFGPACQYRDVISASHDNLPWLTDRNDSTCNKDLESVTLTIHIVFTWARLVTQNPTDVNDVRLRFDDGVPCAQRQSFLVNENTIDIHCFNHKVIDRVELSGTGVKSLCSIYISGGRNMALNTKISTTSSTAKGLRKTVDGQLKSCASVNDMTILFQIPRNIQGLVLHSDNNDPQNVIVKVFSTESDHYQQLDDPKHPGFPHVVIMPLIENVTRLKVMAEGGFSAKIKICETEVYGDTVCGPGSHGPSCQKGCKCLRDICFVSTGGCPYGCEGGKRYENCAEPIPVTTPDKPPSHNRSTTQPSQRRKGTLTILPMTTKRRYPQIITKSTMTEQRYSKNVPTATSNVNIYPILETDTQVSRTSKQDTTFKSHLKLDTAAISISGTTQPVPNGHHSSCLSRCLFGVCTPEDRCFYSCAAGYHGSSCREMCPDGLWGINCALICGRTCSLSRPCDKISGKCVLCDPGYYGNHCTQQCSEGFYGLGCSKKCSKDCVGACHHISGQCSTCRYFEGSVKCPANDSYDSSKTGVLYILISTFIMTFVLIW